MAGLEKAITLHYLQKINLSCARTDNGNTNPLLVSAEHLAEQKILNSFYFGKIMKSDDKGEESDARIVFTRSYDLRKG